MINKDIITFILGIIYLSDIYKKNNLFKLNNRNIVIIILIIQLINKFHIREQFTNSCEPGYDCSCDFIQDTTENTKIFNSINYALSHMKDVIINGDLTINGDLELGADINEFNKLSIQEFDIRGTSLSGKPTIDITRNGGNGNIYLPKGDFKTIECGGINFKDYLNQTLTYVDERVEKVNPLFRGDLTVHGGVHIIGTASATNNGAGVDTAPFVTHYSLYSGPSYFALWSGGFEYWKAAGGYFSEW